MSSARGSTMQTITVSPEWTKQGASRSLGVNYETVDDLVKRHGLLHPGKRKLTVADMHRLAQLLNVKIQIQDR